MPIAIKRIEAQNLTVFVATGGLLINEIWQAFELFFGQKPTAKTLWDFRKTKTIHDYAENIERTLTHAKSKAHKRPPGKTALLAPTDLGFGLSRMTDTFSEIIEIPWEFRSFRTIEAAVEWLEVSYP